MAEMSLLVLLICLTLQTTCYTWKSVSFIKLWFKALNVFKLLWRLFLILSGRWSKKHRGWNTTAGDPQSFLHPLRFMSMLRMRTGWGLIAAWTWPDDYTHRQLFQTPSSHGGDNERHGASISLALRVNTSHWTMWVGGRLTTTTPEVAVWGASLGARRHNTRPARVLPLISKE